MWTLCTPSEPPSTETRYSGRTGAGRVSRLYTNTVGWGRARLVHGRVGSRARLALIVIRSLFCDLVFYFFLKVDKFILLEI